MPIKKGAFWATDILAPPGFYIAPVFFKKQL